MILRDFHTNLDTMDAIKSIASRKYDILLMKMCEDFDRKFLSSLALLPSNSCQRFD